MRFQHLITVFLMLANLAASVCAAENADRTHCSFAVLGHIRGSDNGELNPLLDELLAKVREHSPDFIVLTGDMIWGDLHADVPNADVIERDWDRLDATVNQLGVPVYRVPGNHDISDPVTRDIYFRRYGELPHAFSFGGSRFILFNSSWVPEGSDPPLIRHQYVRGKQLESKQIEFIRKELSADQPYDHVFLFMHHLLWWHREETSWWSEVHPLLVKKNVRAVFGGDYGPMKFSHMRRDGIDYIQTSIEGTPSVRILRDLISSRLLSQQFDNYLYVTINGEDVTVNVEIVGEISQGKFTPEFWRSVNEYVPPEKPILQRLWDEDVLGSPRRLGAVALLTVVCLLSGFFAALILKRYKNDRQVAAPPAED